MDIHDVEPVVNTLTSVDNVGNGVMKDGRVLALVRDSACGTTKHRVKVRCSRDLDSGTDRA